MLIFYRTNKHRLYNVNILQNKQNKHRLYNVNILQNKHCLYNINILPNKQTPSLQCKNILQYIFCFNVMA